MDASPGKEIEVDPDPESNWIRPNVVLFIDIDIKINIRIDIDIDIYIVALFDVGYCS